MYILAWKHGPSHELLPQLKNQMTRLDGTEYAWLPTTVKNEDGSSTDNVCIARSVELEVRRRSPITQRVGCFIEKTLTVGRFTNERLMQNSFGVVRDLGEGSGERIDTSVAMSWIDVQGLGWKEE